MMMASKCDVGFMLGESIPSFASSETRSSSAHLYHTGILPNPPTESFSRLQLLRPHRAVTKLKLAPVIETSLETTPLRLIVVRTLAVWAGVIVFAAAGVGRCDWTNSLQPAGQAAGE